MSETITALKRQEREHARLGAEHQREAAALRKRIRTLTKAQRAARAEEERQTLTLSDEQWRLARHALGLPNERRRSYRNRFCATTGTRDYFEWLALVAIGAAGHEPPSTGGTMHFFWLTPAGAKAALAPRERLCTEDFPESEAGQGEASNTVTISFSTTLTLDETEIRALDAIVGYGDTAFLKALKEKLGEAYIRDHEKGLLSAFEAIRRDVLPALHDIDQTRKDLYDAGRKRIEAARGEREANGHV